ncbi:hypothetical protein GALL_549070 [mine drainage metagenome]|uniref:Uncharacterized protein n=1 Tax=mine drainage metagenome TaxID=410659 RepID=A0A1J5P6Y0_9ZZZZ
MCDVKWHHHQRCARSENDISGFRVDVNVEFRRGGDVSHLEIGAAHEDDFLHPRHHIGRALERGGDVGERPEGAERHGSGRFAAQGFDDEINAVLRLKRHHRVGQHRAIQPGFAMHMLGRDQLAHQGRVTSGKDFYVSHSSEFADDPRVLFSQR